MCPLPSPKALDAAGNVSTALLAPAAYKVCYAYAEDAPADGGAPPDVRLAVELPLGTARLTVRRPAGSAPPRALAHGETLNATVQPGDVAWFGLPLVCGAGSTSMAPTAGCEAIILPVHAHSTHLFAWSLGQGTGEGTHLSIHTLRLCWIKVFLG